MSDLEHAEIIDQGQASLIPLENINALQVFTKQGMDTLLAEIEEEVSKFEPDLSTAKSRGEIKSLAYKVTLSKGVIDRARLDLVKDLKIQAGLIDGCGRTARVFLEDLATKVRQPLTDYEAETAALQAAAEHKARILEAHDAALAEHDVWVREQQLTARQCKLDAEEEARQRIEQGRVEAEEEAKRQEKIRADAQAKAEVEAEQKIEAERQRTKQALLDKHNAENAAAREKKEAEEQATKDKAEAVERERLRMVHEQAERQAEEKRQAEVAAQVEAERQADRDHRKQVNQGALQALVDNGFNQVSAKKIITVIFQGKIPGIRMVY
jgi:colicin import membrane protein